MLKDGSQAWEVKDFLVQQDRCESVTIEGKDYPGKGSTQVSYHALLIVDMILDTLARARSKDNDTGAT